jgi:hypothetical protein
MEEVGRFSKNGHLKKSRSWLSAVFITLVYTTRKRKLQSAKRLLASVHNAWVATLFAIMHNRNLLCIIAKTLSQNAFETCYRDYWMTTSNGFLKIE